MHAEFSYNKNNFIFISIFYIFFIFVDFGVVTVELALPGTTTANLPT